MNICELMTVVKHGEKVKMLFSGGTNDPGLYLVHFYGRLYLSEEGLSKECASDLFDLKRLTTSDFEIVSDEEYYENTRDGVALTALCCNATEKANEIK